MFRNARNGEKGESGKNSSKGWWKFKWDVKEAPSCFNNWRKGQTWQKTKMANLAKTTRLARKFARGLAKIQLLKLHVDHYCFFLLFEFSTKIWNFTCLNFAGIFIRGRLISHMKWKSMGTWHLHMKSRNSELGWYAPFRLRSFRKYGLWFEAMQFFYCL